MTVHHCDTAKLSQKKLYAKEGFQNMRYSDSRPIGVIIATITKEACPWCNLECTGR